eukprot:scaffold222047_cov38-Prasinocladus_malaysianus.AAC.1
MFDIILQNIVRANAELKPHSCRFGCVTPREGVTMRVYARHRGDYCRCPNIAGANSRTSQLASGRNAQVASAASSGTAMAVASACI